MITKDLVYNIYNKYTMLIIKNEESLINLFCLTKQRHIKYSIIEILQSFILKVPSMENTKSEEMTVNKDSLFTKVYLLDCVLSK